MKSLGGPIRLITAFSMFVPFQFATAAPTVQRTTQSASDAPVRASNVLVWMIDDLGFGQMGCFGGLIATPTLDALAANGLRYTNYHTAPICSASRASFLTGRNPHTVHMGGHAALALPYPGYDAKVPRSAGTVAENLHQNGYITYALGKWDHLPTGDTSAAGPFTYWPSGQGFDRFYGFLTAESDNFQPQLWADHTPVRIPLDPTYHLTADLADHAIEFIRSRTTTAPRRPFFMYWATGAVHSPHHAPEAYRLRYRGKFDMGWDKAREQILHRQIELGIVPAGTRLGPRPPDLPAWDSLSAQQKQLYARQMEVFAAQLTHADEQFGRIIESLRRNGELDDTLIVVTSDNGASAEGAINGSYNDNLFLGGRYPTVEQNLVHYGDWGSAKTFPHYSYGWAVAGNTPFRYYKQTTYEGGTRVPLIISWPKGIGDRGELRRQYQHVSDLTPTILEATGTKPAAQVNDEKQMPFDGTSLKYTFTDRQAASRKHVQYSEMFGNRAIWSDGWKAVNPHRFHTWSLMADPPLTNVWELYNVDRDPSETNNLAASQPQRLKQLIALFDREAKLHNVFPLTSFSTGFQTVVKGSEEEFGARAGIWAYPAPIGRVPVGRAPPILARSYTMTASLDLRGGDSGPIIAEGGTYGGIAFYLLDGLPILTYRDPDFSIWTIRGETPLPRGKTALQLRFDKTAMGANIAIRADGKLVASGSIAHPIHAQVAPGESFGIGVDSGTAVATDYPPGAMLAAPVQDVRFDFNEQQRSATTDR